MTAYSLQSTSEYIYQNISKKLETFFAPYLPGAQASDFYELEIASAGVMRGFMGRPCDLYFTIERKLRRFLSCCMRLYCVPLPVRMLTVPLTQEIMTCLPAGFIPSGMAVPDFTSSGGSVSGAVSAL